jgi:hypothetical protein
MKILRVFLFVGLSLLVGGCVVYDYLFAINTNSSINKESFVWKSDTTEMVIFYYENGSTADKNIEEIKKITLNDIKKLLAIIHVENYDGQLTYFLVESRKRMKELIGHEINAGAIPRQNAVYAVYGEVKAIGMHEFNHIIVHNTWGNPSNKWMSEGFAVYSDDEWGSYDLHSLSKYFLDKNKIILLNDLFGRFDSYEERITYPQAGSFVKYIIENYGSDKFRELWSKGDDAISEVYNKSIYVLEKEWLEEIKKSNSAGIDYKL